jgi:hypothetical protein
MGKRFMRFEPPIDVIVINDRTGRTLAGRCVAHDTRMRRLYVSFPLWEELSFATSDGRGKGRARAWRIDVDGMRNVLGDETFHPSIALARAPRATRKPNEVQVDPRQMELF